jgi:hypothetical protein
MFETKSDEGQKQSTSVLELQPSVNNQVFRHWGRTLGQGAVVTGPLGVVVVVATTADVVARVVEDSCSHLVQIVFVVVTRTVDVEADTSMLVVPPVVWVSVTGQTVVVVSTTTVVMTSLTDGDGVDEVVPATVEVVTALETDEALEEDELVEAETTEEVV